MNSKQPVQQHTLLQGNHEDFLTALKQAYAGDQCLTDPGECLAYSYDYSKNKTLPIAVVFAQQVADIQTLVQLARQYKIPITVRGRASGLVGGAVPSPGGVTLSIERLRKMTIDPDNRLIVAEPGVLNQEVQDLAAEHGFFWAPDPSSREFCSVGGNLGYNAGGPRAVKYGTTRDNTLGLTAVTGTGELLKTGVKTTKGVVGYDLTRLLIGSEGTLGIITEAILKLTPLPEAKLSMSALYNSVDAASAAIVAVMRQSCVPCALEFVDGAALSLIRKHQSIAIAENAQALLMIEIDGPSAALEASMENIIRAATQPGLIDIQSARTDNQQHPLWAARKALSPTLRLLAPKKISEDIAVPVANIPALFKGIDALAQKHAIRIVNFGHAGNGNIHVNLLIDPDDPRQATATEDCLDDLFHLVLTLEGTLSGEHGVGKDKQEFIAAEISPYGLQMMRAIKQVFDPDNILNPDKLFPVATDASS